MREREWEETHLVGPSIGQGRPLAAARTSLVGGTRLCPWGSPRSAQTTLVSLLKKLKLWNFSGIFRQLFPKNLNEIKIS